MSPWAEEELLAAGEVSAERTWEVTELRETLQEEPNNTEEKPRTKNKPPNPFCPGSGCHKSMGCGRWVQDLPVPWSRVVLGLSTAEPGCEHPEGRSRCGFTGVTFTFTCL